MLSINNCKARQTIALALGRVEFRNGKEQEHSKWRFLLFVVMGKLYEVEEVWREPGGGEYRLGPLGLLRTCKSASR